MALKDEWVVGWGDGITGPTTPGVTGATVAAELQNYRTGDPAGNYAVISNGQRECVAILPILNGETLLDAQLRAEGILQWKKDAAELQKLKVTLMRQLVKAWIDDSNSGTKI